MHGMMMKLGGASYNGEPEFYSELKEKPKFSAGDEVTAKVMIKSVTESVCESGEKCWSYEACVTELGGKDAAKMAEKPEKDEDAIEKGLDEAMGEMEDEDEESEEEKE